MLNRHGISWKVDGHLQTASTATRHGDESELTLYPVVFPDNISPRLNEFLCEVDRCTPKILLPLDTLPSKFPNRAHANGHWVDAWAHPDCVHFFFDAANVSEAVFAHELGHVWIDAVRDVEDNRVWRDRDDMPRYNQIQNLQSFVLDVAVDQVMDEKGFDRSLIDCDHEAALAQLRMASELGYVCENLREGVFVATQLAGSLIHEKDSPALAKALDVMPVIRRNQPALYVLAEDLATAVLDSKPEDRGSTKRAVDEVFRLAFAHTDPDMDYESELLEVEPAINWEFEKNNGWLTGLSPRAKCEIGVAMAKLGANNSHTPVLHREDSGPVTVHFTLPDGTRTDSTILNHVAGIEDQGVKRANEIAELVRQTKKRAETMQKLTQIQPFKAPEMRRAPRMYSAGTARWLTAVRLQELLEGEHPYSYAEINPVTYSDPSGLQTRQKPPKPGGKCSIYLCHARRFLSHSCLDVVGSKEPCSYSSYPSGIERCSGVHLDPANWDCELVSTSCEFADSVCKCIEKSQGDNYLPFVCWGNARNKICCGCHGLPKAKRNICEAKYCPPAAISNPGYGGVGGGGGGAGPGSKFI